MPTNSNLPSFSQIRDQLQPLSKLETVSVVFIPLSVFVLYFGLAAFQLYLLAVLCPVYLSFVTYGSCSHDLVHANCGIGRKKSHFWLSVIELCMLRSGTVYRLVHLNHHRLYPDFERDPEGRASYFTLLRTLLEGPIFQMRLCAWAFKNSRQTDRQRILLELLLVLCFLIAGLSVVHIWPWLLVYQILVIMGAWTIPLITSYLVHLPHGEDPLHQTRLYRGWLIRLIALDHLYHLEHHLYPMVSHHRWSQLAEVLNPVFEQAGLAVVALPRERDRPYALN